MLRYILPVPFQVSQYEGLEKDSFTAAEAFNMIYNFVWKPTISGRTLTESQMNLQKQYIYMMMQTAGFTIKGAGKALTGENHLTSITASSDILVARDMLSKRMLYTTL